MRTFYEILNVSPRCESAAIRAAYRARIAKYHPDTFEGDTAEAEQMSRLINEAYRVLGDPDRRAAYNANLARAISSQRAAQPARRPLPKQRVSMLFNKMPRRVTFADSSDRGSQGFFRGVSQAQASLAIALLTIMIVFALRMQPQSNDRLAPSGGADLASSSPSAALAGDASSQHPPDELTIARTSSLDRPSAQSRQGHSSASLPPRTPVNVSAEDRNTVELACLRDRLISQKNYTDCLHRNYADLQFRAYPLGGLSRPDRQKVELACIELRMNGPADYNECLANQAAKIGSQNGRKVAPAGTSNN